LKMWCWFKCRDFFQAEHLTRNAWVSVVDVEGCKIKKVEVVPHVRDGNDKEKMWRWFKCRDFF